MAKETADTTLGIIEEHCYDTLATTPSPYEARDMLVALGFTHLAMGPQESVLAFQEIWAGMHGRSGTENLGILATVLGTVFNSGPNPLTVEYAAAKARDAK